MAVPRVTAHIIEVSLIALLVFTPLARGTVQVWAISIAHSITLVMLTAYLLGAIFSGQPLWVRTPLDLPLLALFLLALISSFFSVDRYASGAALVKLGNYIVLYFIVVQTVRRRSQVRHAAYTIMFVGSFLAVFGMIKYLGGVCPPWWDYDVGAGGVVSTFANKNHLAGYMEMAIPMTIGLLIAERRPWARTLCIFCLFSLCVALTLSLSRAGWVFGLLALCFMFILYTLKTKGKYKGLAVTAAAIAGVVALTVLASTPAVERLESLMPTENGPNLQTRIAVSVATLDLVRDHLFLGTGPGTFATAFTAYRPSVGLRFLNAHNDYLQFVSETGILTAFIMLWLAAVAFRASIRKIWAADNQLTLGVTLGALSGIVAIMGHSLVDFNLHIMANAILFTVLASLLMSTPSTAVQRPGHSEQLNNSLAH